MDLITLDFETYYDNNYSLSKLTMEEYIRSPLFEVILVVAKFNNSEPIGRTGTHAEIKEFLQGIDWSNCALLAHNAAFDGAILSWIFDCKPRFIFYTLSMARSVVSAESGHSLDALSKHFKLGEKGFEVHNAKGKRRADFSTDEIISYSKYCTNDVELTYKLFKVLSKSFATKELEVIDVTLRMYTEPVIELNKELLETELEEERIRADKFLLELGVEAGHLRSDQTFAQLLTQAGVEDLPHKFSAAKGSQVYAFAKTDDGFKALLEHESSTVRMLCEARLLLKSSIRTSRAERLISIAQRGPLPILLKYYSAHTGRYGGGDGVNLQNFPNAGGLRKSLQAPPGYAILSVDSAQIECRVLAWIAGQNDLLGKFASGEDVYVDFASALFGYDVAPLGKKSRERFVGKTAILGLGYGMSYKKFKNTVKLQTGVNLSDREGFDAINLYRSKYTRIVQFWSICTNILNRMVDNKEYSDDVLKTCGNRIVLPNGLTLTYTGLQRAEPFDFVMPQSFTQAAFVYFKDNKTYVQAGLNKLAGISAVGLYEKIYGAKLTENIVQALARIIITDQMVALSKHFKVLFQVHDENVILVPETDLDNTKKVVHQIMTTPPKWAANLPLDCNIMVGPNYGELQ